MKPLQQSLFSAVPLPKAVPVLRRRAPRPALKRRTPLWIALYLPQLPLEALLGGQDLSLLCAVIESSQGAARIVCVNRRAADSGITPGMTLTSAWALLPALEVHERDPAREQELLRRLAAWGHRFTPASCIDAQTVLLEVRASLALFGGPAALLEAVRRGLRQLGFTAAFAAAPTPRAAMWLAHAGCDVHVDDTDALPGVLGNLPLQAAHFDAALEEKLRGLGAHCLRDLIRLPRDGFARRYGARALRELDQALGRVPDVRRPLPPPKRFSARIDLLYEINETERLQYPIRQLLRELDAYLQATQQGVSRLTLCLQHRDGETTPVMLGFASATRDAARISDLVEQRLENVALPAPVLEVVLRAEELSPLAGTDRALFMEQQSEDWPQLVERLRVRLGEDAVQGVAQQQDHRPERAWRFIALGHAQEAEHISPRPHWLLAEPRPLPLCGGWPAAEGRPLEIIDGPERIETGWWDDADTRRDYFIALDRHGRRLWICRDVKTGKWWWQGIFE